jgi:hypothetical protein
MFALGMYNAGVMLRFTVLFLLSGIGLLIFVGGHRLFIFGLTSLICGQSLPSLTAAWWTFALGMYNAGVMLRFTVLFLLSGIGLLIFVGGHQLFIFGLTSLICGQSLPSLTAAWWTFALGMYNAGVM